MYCTLELVKYFQKNCKFFQHFSPRATGRRRLPVGGPPLGEICFTELIKIKDFRVEIIVFMYFLMSFPMKTFVCFL